MTSREEKIGIALILNTVFAAIEAVGGVLTNSLTILSNALHDFGDSFFLFTSLLAEKGAKKKPDSRRTFGYQRLSLFAAVGSAIFLVSGSLFILSQAVPRLLAPEPVDGGGMVALAVVGIAFNLAGYWRLKAGQSVSERVLTWHLMEDVLGWVTVFVGGLIVFFFNFYPLDPLLTMGFSLFIFFGALRNLKEALNIFLQGVPSHIDPSHVRAGLLSINGVRDVHDLHIWSLEGETDFLTAHIVVEEKLLKDPAGTIKMIKEELVHHHIEHSTIELESKKSKDPGCEEP